jgi:hypothetical protein
MHIILDSAKLLKKNDDEAGAFVTGRRILISLTLEVAPLDVPVVVMTHASRKNSCDQGFANHIYRKQHSSYHREGEKTNRE